MEARVNQQESTLTELSEFIYSNTTVHNVINCLIEEMSELMQQLCKQERSRGDFDNLCEEIADVELNLDLLKRKYNISEVKINEIKLYKLSRFRKRLLDKEPV